MEPLSVCRAVWKTRLGAFEGDKIRNNGLRSYSILAATNWSAIIIDVSRCFFCNEVLISPLPFWFIFKDTYLTFVDEIAKAICHSNQKSLTSMFKEFSYHLFFTTVTYKGFQWLTIKYQILFWRVSNWSGFLKEFLKNSDRKIRWLQQSRKILETCILLSYLIL